VDVSDPTGVLCNVDLIHFVWNSFEFISHKRFALTLIPSDFTGGKPMLLGLKYYRAISDGWKDGSNFTACMEDYRRSVRDDVGCLLRHTCRCNVCLCQPPKLFYLAQRVYSKFVYNLDRFMLTPDTTYGQYVYAAHSTVKQYTQLLPPTYTNITLHRWFETLTHRLQSDCPGSCLYRTFSRVGDALSELYHDENIYRCRYCRKCLFFPFVSPDPYHRSD
jgi:hypothetical protein